MTQNHVLLCFIHFVMCIQHQNYVQTVSAKHYTILGYFIFTDTFIHPNYCMTVKTLFVVHGIKKNSQTKTTCLDRNYLQSTVVESTVICRNRRKLTASSHGTTTVTFRSMLEKTNKLVLEYNASNLDVAAVKLQILSC